MILASLLSSSSYIITNKFLIKALGTDAEILIGELCSEYNYWEQKDGLKDDEWFFSTRENIEDNTGLSEHKQRVAINLLEKKKLIETKRMGIPCKTYYKLNEENILNIIKEVQKSFKSPKNSDVQKLDIKNSKKSQSGDEENQQQGIENIDTNNNNKNNNKEHTHEENIEEEKEEYAPKVFLSQKEYLDLLKTYGEESTKEMVKQLSLYKVANGKSYNNDYAAILRWVTTKLHEIEKEKANYESFKKKKDINKFNQREYPPGFFDSLYANNK